MSTSDQHLPSIVQVNPKNLVGAFLSGRNPRTLRAYTQDLKDFQAFVKQESIEDASAFLLSLHQGQANAIVLSYKNSLLQKGLSVATVNRRISAIKALVKMARMVGLTALSVEISAIPQENYRDTRGPGRDGFQKMLEALSGRQDNKGKRDTAIIRLLYDVALRRSEVLSLDVKHIDFARSTISIHGKGRAQRQLMRLPAPTFEALQSWLGVRGRAPGPLFTTLDPAKKGDGRLSANGLYLMIKEIGEEVGLIVRPHGLRHAAITDALDATQGDVRAVQKFSRHKDIRVLVRYDDARNDLGAQVADLVAKRSV